MVVNTSPSRSWRPRRTSSAPECASEAIGAIRRQAKDFPIIQLTAGNDAEAITEALMLGAQDALPQGEDEWLLLVANRELARRVGMPWREEYADDRAAFQRDFDRARRVLGGREPGR